MFTGIAIELCPGPEDQVFDDEIKRGGLAFLYFAKKLKIGFQLL